MVSFLINSVSESHQPIVIAEESSNVILLSESGLYPRNALPSLNAGNGRIHPRRTSDAYQRLRSGVDVVNWDLY